ncbi:hypothetical protein G6F68_019763 [Rhizopus microsporus]|nr:hypothetical protein G6F68_019763 [Rhizopus microsporus]
MACWARLRVLKKRAAHSQMSRRTLGDSGESSCIGAFNSGGLLRRRGWAGSARQPGPPISGRTPDARSWRWLPNRHSGRSVGRTWVSPSRSSIEHASSTTPIKASAMPRPTRSR